MNGAITELWASAIKAPRRSSIVINGTIHSLFAAKNPNSSRPIRKRLRKTRKKATRVTPFWSDMLSAGCIQVNAVLASFKDPGGNPMCLVEMENGKAKIL
jgi:hypothetical protein